MYAFQLHNASSGKEAATMITGKDDAKYLAGGQSLIAAMKLRLNAPSDLVNLSQASDLKGIRSDGRTVTIGAMTTHAEVASSADVMKAIPALAALAGAIGAPPALIGAICDAINVRDIAMPATPHRVWQAMQTAQA